MPGHTLYTSLCVCINVLEPTNYRQHETAYGHFPTIQPSVTKNVSGHNEIPDHKMNDNWLPCHLRATLDMPKELDSYSMNCSCIYDNRIHTMK